MRFGAITLGVLAMGLAAGAWASPDTEPFEEKCGTAPFGPDIPADPTLPDAKMSEIKADVIAFIKSSDQFQDCIDRTLVQGPKLKKDLSRDEITKVQDRFARAGVKIMADNQAEKERVGDLFNALVDQRKKGGVAKPAVAAKPEAAPAIPTAPQGMLPEAPASRSTAKAKPLEKPSGL